MAPTRGTLTRTINSKNHLAGKVVTSGLHILFHIRTRLSAIYLAFHICRGKNQRGKMARDGSWTTEMDNQPSEPASDTGDLGDITRSSKAGDCELEAVVHDLRDRMMRLEQHVIKTEKVKLLIICHDLKFLLV